VLPPTHRIFTHDTPVAMHPPYRFSLGGYAAGCLLCSLLLIAGAGCSDEKPPLDTETMRTVLVDLHLAESRLSTPGVDTTLVCRVIAYWPATT